MNALEFLSLATDLVLGITGGIYSIISAILTLIIDGLVLGFASFVIELLGYIPILFIIVEGAIIFFCVTMGKDEQGKQSPFKMMELFFTYNIGLIVMSGKVMLFCLEVLHKIINTLIPV